MAHYEGLNLQKTPIKSLNLFWSLIPFLPSADDLNLANLISAININIYTLLRFFL